MKKKFSKGDPKKSKLKKNNFLDHLKILKTLFKAFLRTTLYLFGPLFPKYQHFLAFKAHISEIRAEIEKVAVA